MLNVEVADTNLKREYGLMDRHSLPSDSGMLFKFPHKRVLSFWMRNTYIPLQIAFIDDSGKIFQIEEMAPMSTRAIRSKNECKYALEVNRGWFEKNKINVGCKLIGCGFGDEKSSNLKFAQSNVAQEEIATQPPMGSDQNTQNSGKQIDSNQNTPQESATATDSQMNFSIKKRFQRVNAHNRLLVNRDRQADVLIIYQTEKGVTLLPRVIRGPYTFVPGSTGDLVLVEDVSPSVSGTHPNGEDWSCEPGLKTFLIDNILSMREVKRNDTTQDQEIIAWMRELPESKLLKENQYNEWNPAGNANPPVV